MNILTLIKQLQEIADTIDPTLEVCCEDGMNPSDLCPIHEVRFNFSSHLGKSVVEVVS